MVATSFCPFYVLLVILKMTSNNYIDHTDVYVNQ